MIQPITVRDDLAARLATLAATRGETLEGLIEARLEEWIAREEAARTTNTPFAQKLEALLHAAEALRLKLPGSGSGCDCSERTCLRHVNAWYWLIETENALRRAIKETEYVRIQGWEPTWLGGRTSDDYGDFCEVVVSDASMRTYDLGQGSVHTHPAGPEGARDVFWTLLIRSWEWLSEIEQAGETHYFFRQGRNARGLADALANYEP